MCCHRKRAFIRIRSARAKSPSSRATDLSHLSGRGVLRETSIASSLFRDGASTRVAGSGSSAGEMSSLATESSEAPLVRFCCPSAQASHAAVAALDGIGHPAGGRSMLTAIPARRWIQRGARKLSSSRREVRACRFPDHHPASVFAPRPAVGSSSRKDHWHAADASPLRVFAWRPRGFRLDIIVPLPPERHNSTGHAPHVLEHEAFRSPCVPA